MWTTGRPSRHLQHVEPPVKTLVKDREARGKTHKAAWNANQPTHQETKEVEFKNLGPLPGRIRVLADPHFRVRLTKKSRNLAIQLQATSFLPRAARCRSWWGLGMWIFGLGLFCRAHRISAPELLKVHTLLEQSGWVRHPTKSGRRHRYQLP